MTAAPFLLRVARDADVKALEALIPLSVRALQSDHYSSVQMDAALGLVFGVDRQLIRDRTYFVAEHEGRIVGCGGWSRRSSHYGGDSGRHGEEALLDPHRGAPRIRAFFVHPSWARRGIGRGILQAPEQALSAAGFERSTSLRRWPASRSMRRSVIRSSSARSPR
jgi:GNAT superfamily N-acetyltransferase